MIWSISSCFVGSLPITFGAINLLTLSTAVRTPFPNHFVLSLSLSSRASWIPVLAPEGTAALNNPLSVVISTSIVGFPLLS